MSETQNKQIARRRFLEFTGKTMVVAGIGAIVTLSNKFVASAAATCCSPQCYCEAPYGACYCYDDCPCQWDVPPCTCDPIDCPCECEAYVP